MADIGSLRPRLLIHGHTTLTEQFTAEAVPAAAAAATLISQGDHALALQIIQPGLLRHPASITLAGLRRTTLHRLMEQYQQTDPFKFLIYAELARR